MTNQVPLICFVPVLFMVFIVGVLLGIFLNWYRGRWIIRQNHGEIAVREVIVKNFKSPQYHLLNNITVPSQSGTTQIDHILISTKGVFVIETKDYSGWIFGAENSKQWTQVIYRIKNKFQNPIHQNYKHVKTIQNLLDFLPKEKIHSIVVFTGDADFKTAVPDNVIYLDQLVDYIKFYSDEDISLNRVEFCVGRLECRRYEVTKKTDLEHRAYLSKRFGSKFD